MFYAQLLMNKRGPLSKIWLAAHWDKKVTKAHIFECNLEMTVEKLLSPKFKIALRTSGHLLLGVVRIYHRKAKYLLSDCTEALLKMQLAFRPGLVDLPKGSSEAKYDTITLPEEFHEFDVQLPEVNAIDVAQHFTLNQSRPEDITLLEEDYRLDLLSHCNSFGEDAEIARHQRFLSDTLQASFSSLSADHNSLNLIGDKTMLDESAYSLMCDGFGDEGFAGDMIDDVLGAEKNLFIIDMEEEEEVFLPQELPAETSVVLKRKQRRKRKLLVDAVKVLSKSTIQKQLENYKDILTTLDIAPPTRKLMALRESGGVDKLMRTATQPLIHEDLQMLFAKSLRGGRKKLRQDLETQDKNKRQGPQGNSGFLKKVLTASENGGLERRPAGRQKSRSDMPETISHSAPQSACSGEDEREDRKTAEAMEAVDMLSALSDGPLAVSSGRQEAERWHTEAENELQESSLEYEEKRQNKRALDLLNAFQHIRQTGAKSFSFLTLCMKKNRQEVATMFYSLLILKKQLAVEVSQAASYADIIVTAGPKFHTT